MSNIGKLVYCINILDKYVIGKFLKRNFFMTTYKLKPCYRAFSKVRQILTAFTDTKSIA